MTDDLTLTLETTEPITYEWELRYYAVELALRQHASHTPLDATLIKSAKAILKFLETNIDWDHS